MISCLPGLNQSTKQRKSIALFKDHFAKIIQQIQAAKKNGNGFEKAVKSQHLFCFKASNGFTIESAMILLWNQH